MNQTAYPIPIWAEDKVPLQPFIQACRDLGLRAYTATAEKTDKVVQVFHTPCVTLEKKIPVHSGGEYVVRAYLLTYDRQRLPADFQHLPVEAVRYVVFPFLVLEFELVAPEEEVLPLDTQTQLKHSMLENITFVVQTLREGGYRIQKFFADDCWRMVVGEDERERIILIQEGDSIERCLLSVPDRKLVVVEQFDETC